MKAFIFSFSLIIYGTIQVPAFSQSPDKTFSFHGEWERVGDSTEGNIGKIIFYPNGTVNVINPKNTEVRVLRYRLLSPSAPITGEIISAPFGLGQLKDRIPFTIHFENPNNLYFTYTANGKSQSLYLKKIKDIPHGIIPLSRPYWPNKNLLAVLP